VDRKIYITTESQNRTWKNLFTWRRSNKMRKEKVKKN